MAGLLKPLGPRPAAATYAPCTPSTSSALRHHHQQPCSNRKPIGGQTTYWQSAALWVCSAKRSSKTAGDDEAPAPRRRASRAKPKEEEPVSEPAPAEAAAAPEEEAPAPRKRGRRPKAVPAEEQVQPQAPAISAAAPGAPVNAAPEPLATQNTLFDATSASVSAAPITTLDTTSAVQPAWMDDATSVLEQSVKRRGRPRVLDEYAPPVSPQEDAEEPPMEEAPLIVSQEVIDALQAIEPKPWTVELREEEQPKNWGEEPYGDAILSDRFWTRRRAESKEIEEQAWQMHHYQNRHAANRYLTVRRVARLMAEVENHDFMREADAPHHIPSWSRAELVFKDEFAEFNEFVKENMAKVSSLNLQMEEEEEAQERMDQLDMLSPSNARSTSRDLEKIERASSEAWLVDRFLDNILPGATLSSMSEVFADDIFAAEADGDDDDAAIADEVDAPAPAAAG